MKKRVKIAVVGVGLMGSQHLKAIKKLGITTHHRKTFSPIIKKT